MITLLFNSGLSFQDLFPLIGGLAFMAGGCMLVMAVRRERLQVLERRVASVRPGQGRAGGQAGRGHAQQSASKTELSSPEHRQIMRLFSRFDITPEQAVHYFATTRAGLAIGGAAIALVAAPFSSPVFILMTGLGVAIIGYYLPAIIVGIGLKRHRKEVFTGLPDALELLAICVEAGLSLEIGLQRVSKEIKLTQPALSDELSQTWAEISILPSRDMALNNLAKRLDHPIVHTVVGTLIQSLQYGSPLAQSLRAAASEMRNDQLTNMEERANRLPALMTIPVMVMIMPTIFLIVGGPAVLRVMDIF